MNALDRSIEHWEGIVEVLRTADGPIEIVDGHIYRIGDMLINIGPRACALCEEYPGCFKLGEQCPVARKTGYLGCKGSPWYRVWNALNGGNRKKAWFGAAAMLAYLKDLRRPEDEGDKS